ncbi:hypothetical protein FOA52_013080 [Chlamydomonas sp. UWO 241]|nr:hypothetical protein FOA52_013080 [Chlamydomonas sp. UWO 241]
MLRAQPRFVRELIAGGVAGGLAKTSIAPLERTKILLQTGQSGTMGIWGTLKFLWTTEGIRGMFRGNSASVLRIVPYAAIHFSAYEWYRRLIVEQYMAPDARTHTGRTGRHSAAAEGAGAGGGGVSSSSGANSRSSSVSSSGVVGASGRTLSASDPLVDLMAGSASGATAVLITYPLDLLRAQLAYSTALEGGSNGAPPRPLGLRGLVQRTLTEHGWSGLYRGVGPTLLGILPYAGIKFYVYTSLKLAYKAEYPGGAAPSAVDGGAPGAGPGGKLPVPVMLLFGGVSGLIAQTATYPLDLIRRRQQVDSITRHHSTAPHKAPTSISVLSSIVREHGMRGLFRGVSINYIKSVPSTAIGFTVYDQLKSYLGLHNHLA